jgi:hypothetical protein
MPGYRGRRIGGNNSQCVNYFTARSACARLNAGSLRRRIQSPPAPGAPNGAEGSMPFNPSRVTRGKAALPPITAKEADSDQFSQANRRLYGRYRDHVCPGPVRTCLGEGWWRRRRFAWFTRTRSPPAPRFSGQLPSGPRSWKRLCRRPQTSNQALRQYRWLSSRAALQLDESPHRTSQRSS